jgi:DNA polymerase-3 subunit epsilon
MKVLAPVVAVLIVVGLIVKFIWWILGIAVIAAVVYVIWRVVTQSSSTASSTPKSTSHQVTPHKSQAPRIQTSSPRIAVTIQEPAARPAPPTRPRPTGLRCAQLTRRRTPYPAKGLVFTAIDIETTGLDPYTDRIVEIGLVKFTSDGEVFDEFATLINNPGHHARPGKSITSMTPTSSAHPPSTKYFPKLLRSLPGRC